jgi:hypothetical protein
MFTLSFLFAASFNTGDEVSIFLNQLLTNLDELAVKTHYV